MKQFENRRRWGGVDSPWLFGCLLILAMGDVSALRGASISSLRPTDGLHRNPSEAHALVGLKIVQGPGREIEFGTITLESGVITGVASGRQVPEGFREWDLTGRTAYAGFIDAYSEVDVASEASTGGDYWNRYIQPGRVITGDNGHTVEKSRALMGQGILLRLLAPRDGIIKGRSSLVSTDAGSFSQRLVVADVAEHLRLTVPYNRDRDYYPNSPMGAVALARQSFYDAEWYGRAWKAFRNQPGLPRPETSRSLAKLGAFLREGGLFVVDVTNEQAFLRADDFAREFSLPLAVRGSGREYFRLEEIRGTGRSVILPLAFPQPPNVSTPEKAAEASLRELMHWALAPENPGRLDAAGVSIAFTTEGLKSVGDFIKQIRVAIKRGLGARAALAALTTRPARMFGVEDRYGSIDVGKMANLVIADGDLLEGEGDVVSAWVHGEYHALITNEGEGLKGEWLVSDNADEWLKGSHIRFSQRNKKWSGSLERTERDSSEEEAESEKALKLEKIAFAANRVQAQLNGRLDSTRDDDEILRLSATFVPSSDGHQLIGSIVGQSGEVVAFTATRSTSESESKETKSQAHSASDTPSWERVSVNYPLGAFGYGDEPKQPAALVIENATLWTCGPAGIIQQGSILIEQGIIKEVGAAVSVPDGAVRIDAAGRSVTPGIIDCHSHMATDGGVNESAQAVTAEVRIGDFVDANDINIYRQLAGGVTTANILHGSANPIGGQNQVIKLRWGATFDELRFAEAPAGIKFALGENVKHSNRGERYTTRYPQTRMGVVEIIEDAFHTAEKYGRQWEAWEREHSGLPPRRDLEYETIWQILEGERWVHCHSYRQDEILALIRTLDRFGVRIGTFQHILEGYKVAPEMAKHGAMASAFSDWWAYKVEVKDAIPYNGALMHEAGLVVSFNSDDRELARHLNQEAAKAVKYGEVPEVEALKFVTLNPARQLRIDSYVGSLEAGKHADFVIWSGSPLSNLSRCEQTWIDGRCYFSLERDRELRSDAAELRKFLVRRVIESGQPPRKSGELSNDESGMWPRHDEFCAPHGGHHHDDIHLNALINR